ncbi:BCCT family transporter [Oceanirhabdus seepicola]|uniref:BCCT family transporter n=1 Tax=Oceanirhabdus seepicola TaxID=2828781 RepID=A0A9J6P4F7_9CLOT|nr:BCCT family transporter [Oceanirhabdus seepicola]MCM1991022.1 BCCT family transporter [Oceanirhabdus seepicola]
MNKKNESVYYISIAITLFLIVVGVFAPDTFKVVGEGAYEFCVNKFSWFYLVGMFAFVVFAIWIAFSKYGLVRLGPDDSRPDYSNASWFAMLFSAGMGIGLVFWGVAEPLNHFVSAGGTSEAANFAIKKSFFHWGLAPWANYTILGLALAYFQFRKNKPGLISTIFIPLIGEKGVKGPIGKTIDVLAIFATVAGMATSLGLGTLQINSGFNHLFGMPKTMTVIVAIVVIITIFYILTAVTGVDKGIKMLSDLNLWLAGGLVVAALLIGPTIKIIETLTNGMGAYLGNFIQDSLSIDSFGDKTWLGGWTILYWAWWIAWAPFVGTFIARISRGRTIREFVAGVLIFPTVGSAVWFSIFGTLGIDASMKQGFDFAQSAISETSTALFKVFELYPFGTVLSLVAIVLLITFFVTSANSATFVLGMMSSNGDLNPSNKKKVVWGVLLSTFALALIYSGAKGGNIESGLKMLQTASLAAALPFAVVLCFCMVSIVKTLKSDVASGELKIEK